jgi:DNA-binding CsgD family transcriptional regulator
VCSDRIRQWPVLAACPTCVTSAQQQDAPLIDAVGAGESGPLVLRCESCGGDRARRELLAKGETVRKRRVETRGDLSAQEAQIARLARDGLTNPEIGAQLFISPRTVQYHLRKVFLKLGISSRAELERVLPQGPAAPSL